jgi:hypothetical protein
MAVFIGYQGIGKSTLSHKNSAYIDFESGNFWVDGVRNPDWYKVYAQCVLDLASQGYHVFTASHKVFREYIYKINLKSDKKQELYVIHPSLELKDFWIDKLQKRYDNSALDKDYKALMNAKERYDENIRELIVDPIPSIIIKDKNYDLIDVIAGGMFDKCCDMEDNII